MPLYHFLKYTHQFFVDAMKNSSGFDKYTMMSLYSTYVKRQPDAEVDKSIAAFEDVARNGSAWWIKLGGYQMLNGIQAHYAKREMEHNNKAESLRKEGKSMEATQEEKEAIHCKNQQESINNMLIEMKSKETDKNVLQYLK